MPSLEGVANHGVMDLPIVWLCVFDTMIVRWRATLLQAKLYMNVAVTPLE